MRGIVLLARKFNGDFALYLDGNLTEGFEMCDRTWYLWQNTLTAPSQRSFLYNPVHILKQREIDESVAETIFRAQHTVYLLFQGWIYLQWRQVQRRVPRIIYKTEWFNYEERWIITDRYWSSEKWKAFLLKYTTSWGGVKGGEKGKCWAGVSPPLEHLELAVIG